MTQKSAKYIFYYIPESIRLPLTENHLPSGILQTTAKKYSDSNFGLIIIFFGFSEIYRRRVC